MVAEGGVWSAMIVADDPGLVAWVRCSEEAWGRWQAHSRSEVWMKRSAIA
jgi:hypothetical protein